MNYINKVRKSRLKKGQQPRFRRGQMVKIAKSNSLPASLPAMLVTDVNFAQDLGASVENFAKSSSSKNLIGMLLILETRNFPYPQNRQYCRVACFQTNESGWISSEFLEIIQ